MKHFLKNKGKRLTAAVLVCRDVSDGSAYVRFAFTAEEGKV